MVVPALVFHGSCSVDSVRAVDELEFSQMVEANSAQPSARKPETEKYHFIKSTTKTAKKR
jgi:hypothetical protein